MRPGEIPGDRVSVDPDTLKQIGINPASLIPFDGGIQDTVRWFHDHWLPGHVQNADTLTMEPVMETRVFSGTKRLDV
jgi:hypothetical protein